VTQANSPTSAPAGWYHYQGDPPGTVRRWNGLEWIGSPIREPSAEDLAAGGFAPTEYAAAQQSRVGSAHHHTVRRLGAGGQALGLTTIMVLGGFAALLGFTALRVFRAAADLPTSRRIDAGEIFDYIAGSDVLATGIVLAVIVTAATFMPWIRSAAKAAQIRTYHAGRYRAKDRKKGKIELAVLIFLLGPAFLGYLVLKSWVNDVGGASASNQSRGLLGVVLDTAMVSSIDPRTGLSKISPITIMLWWVLWWGPLMVSTVTLVGGWILGPLEADTLRTIVQAHGLLLALEALSLVCLMATVAQINSRLSRAT